MIIKCIFILYEFNFMDVKIYCYVFVELYKF
jgi:hypothetical protein